MIEKHIWGSLSYVCSLHKADAGWGVLSVMNEYKYIHIYVYTHIRLKIQSLHILQQVVKKKEKKVSRLNEAELVIL